MSTTITDRQVEALAAEAAADGDDEQVELCRRALAGDAEAREACADHYTCHCDCGCDATATQTESDGGTRVCDQCASYFVDQDGTVLCSRVADGETCHTCGERIRWGGILTGRAGDCRYGDCGCGEDAWSETECGGDWRLGYGVDDDTSEEE